MDEKPVDPGLRGHVRALAADDGSACRAARPRWRPSPPWGDGVSVTFCRTIPAGITAGAPAGDTRAREGAGWDDAAVATALADGLLPVETGRADSPAVAWSPPRRGDGAPARGRRLAITVRHTQDRAATLDALVRTGAAFLRTDPAGLEEAIELGWPSGSTPACRWRSPRPRRPSTRSPPAPSTWSSATGTPTRSAGCATRSPPAPSSSAPPCRWAPRSTTPAPTSPGPCSPPGSPRRRLRRQPPPLHLGARPRRGPPVPARRLSAEWEDDAWRAAAAEEGLGRLDPDLAGILERSLADQPRVAEIERLFRPAATRWRRSRRWRTRCAGAATATRSPTSSTGTSTTPTSATSAAASAASAAARRASTCAATRTS